MTEHGVREGSQPQTSDQESLVHRGRVVQIIAMVKPFRAQAVLAVLEGVDVLAGTVREAMGYGRQKDRLHRYLGSEYNVSFVPKVELAVFVREEDVPAAIKAIVGPGAHRPDWRWEDPRASVLRRVLELVAGQWGVLTQRTRRNRGFSLSSSRSTGIC